MTVVGKLREVRAEKMDVVVDVTDVELSPDGMRTEEVTLESVA